MNRTRSTIGLALVLLGAAAGAAALACSGCRTTHHASVTESRRELYPAAPQISRVAALGNLRGGHAPTATETKVALFLFGAEPAADLAIVKPASIATDGQGLLIGDTGLQALLDWDPAERRLRELGTATAGMQPVAVHAVPDGSWLIADAAHAAVLHLNAEGSELRRFTIELRPFRPAGVALVGEELWVTNSLAHCIEVFDPQTAQHVRSFGQRGAGPVEFGLPLRIAATPSGRIFIVDMLNCRVQVLDEQGKHMRDVGRPGNRVGCLSRPKDVAVGPDGTVFVSDAAFQCIQVFDFEGRPLMAFGGPGHSRDSLALPDGLCITQTPPMEVPLPAGFEAEYYVLVAEQLREPGIRVFAWGQGPGAPVVEAVSTQPHAARPTPTVANPHWVADACGTCHAMDGGRTRPIDAQRVDDLCLSCHDGKKAWAEPHPIRRDMAAAGMKAPAGWPLLNGRIGCLTCHDVIRHCDPSAHRPTANPAFVREYEPSNALAFCTKCHAARDDWRVSPHRQLAADGSADMHTCVFCHTEAPELQNRRRSHEPRLHTAGSDLCLTCHSRHWDVSPLGHVERSMTDAIRRTMLMREGVDPNSDAQPEILPLTDNKVTCYTCHNPHQEGLFPSGARLGARSREPGDAYAAVRVPQSELCLHCHSK